MKPSAGLLQARCAGVPVLLGLAAGGEVELQDALRHLGLRCRDKHKARTQKNTALEAKSHDN